MKQIFEYVELEKLLNGNLRMSLTVDGVDFINSIEDDDWFDDMIFWALLEDVIANSEWQRISPEECGALTSDPYMLSDTIDKDDQGNIISIKSIYYYDSYQVKMLSRELQEKGFVIFNNFTCERG